MKKKDLKKALHAEFDHLIPNVLPNIINKPIVLERIPLPVYRSRFCYYRVVVPVFLVVLISFLGFIGNQYNTPLYYITLLLTPDALTVSAQTSSIDKLLPLSTSSPLDEDSQVEYEVQLGINYYSRVVEITSSHPEIETLFAQTSLKNREIKNALSQFTKQAIANGYLDLLNQRGSLQCNVIDENSNRKERIENYIRGELPDSLQPHGHNNQYNPISLSPEDEALLQQARVEKIPLPKLELILKIRQLDSSYSYQKLKKMGIPELMKILIRLSGNH